MNNELIKRRMEKAKNTYQEGLLLLNADMLDGAVNRFYKEVGL